MKAIAEFLKTYWVIVTVSITIASAIVTGAVKFERKRVAEVQTHNDVIFVKDSTLIYLRQFKSDLQFVKESQINESQSLNDIVSSINNSNEKFKQHLATDKSITKEQYLQLTNGINNLVIQLKEEKKNNETNMLMTQLKQAK